MHLHQDLDAVPSHWCESTFKGSILWQASTSEGCTHSYSEGQYVQMCADHQEMETIFTAKEVPPRNTQALPLKDMVGKVVYAPS